MLATHPDSLQRGSCAVLRARCVFVLEQARGGPAAAGPPRHQPARGPLTTCHLGCHDTLWTGRGRLGVLPRCPACALALLPSRCTASLSRNVPLRRRPRRLSVLRCASVHSPMAAAATLHPPRPLSALQRPEHGARTRFRRRGNCAQVSHGGRPGPLGERTFEVLACAGVQTASWRHPAAAPPRLVPARLHPAFTTHPACPPAPHPTSCTPAARTRSVTKHL
jgi:hypothetical protein